jgi:hypothetical protein
MHLQVLKGLDEGKVFFYVIGSVEVGANPRVYVKMPG